MNQWFWSFLACEIYEFYNWIHDLMWAINRLRLSKWMMHWSKITSWSGFSFHLILDFFQPSTILQVNLEIHLLWHWQVYSKVSLFSPVTTDIHVVNSSALHFLFQWPHGQKILHYLKIFTDPLDKNLELSNIFNFLQTALVDLKDATFCYKLTGLIFISSTQPTLFCMMNWLCSHGTSDCHLNINLWGLPNWMQHKIYPVTWHTNQN